MEMETLVESVAVERIAATVEEIGREEDLRVRLEIVERELADLKASTEKNIEAAASRPIESVRRTLPASTNDLLAKSSIGNGPVDVKTLDAALSGLSLEQRIAVKSQMLRTGAIA